MDYSFGESQHFWFEELNPDYFVEIRVQEKGRGIFSEDLLFTDVIKLGTLPQMMVRFAQDNIWRSWTIFSDYEKTRAIGISPLIFDIDCDLASHGDEIASHERLNGVYQVTLLCLQILLEGELIPKLDASRLRAVFSGFKGFHIEAKLPRAYAAQERQKTRNHLIKEVKERLNSKTPTNTLIEGIVLDNFKQWIRPTGSLYSIQTTNGLKVRKVHQMSVAQFRDLDIHKIIEIAEQF